MMFRVFSITQSITYTSRSVQKGPCGMAKVVTFLPLITKSWAQFKASPMLGLWSKKWHWDRFFSKYFNFHISVTPPMLHFHSSITEVIWQQLTELVKQDRQLTHNTEVHSCNHCCSGKAISIIYYECVFVALVILHAGVHVPYCHVWPVWLYYIFPHYLINGTIKKKINWT
jgi:hypothetical protein